MVLSPSVVNRASKQPRTSDFGLNQQHHPSIRIRVSALGGFIFEYETNPPRPSGIHPNMKTIRMMTATAAAAVLATACAVPPGNENAQQGALGGAVLGGLVGGVIGHQSGHTGTGAALGAAAGAAAGGAYGHSKDRQRNQGYGQGYNQEYYEDNGYQPGY